MRAHPTLLPLALLATLAGAPPSTAQDLGGSLLGLEGSAPQDEVRPCTKIAVHMNECFDDGASPGPGHSPGPATRSEQERLEERVRRLAAAVLQVELAALAAEGSPPSGVLGGEGPFGGVPEAFFRGGRGRTGEVADLRSPPASSPDGSTVSVDALRLIPESVTDGRIEYTAPPQGGRRRTYIVPLSIPDGWDAAARDPEGAAIWIGSPYAGSWNRAASSGIP